MKTLATVLGGWALLTIWFGPIAVSIAPLVSHMSVWAWSLWFAFGPLSIVCAVWLCFDEERALRRFC